jgi:PilZ domain-containing protein
MSAITPPKPGEAVRILAPHARLAGLVTGRENGSLKVELEQTPIRQPFHFAVGADVELEWVHPRGLMQLSARVESALEEPRPTLELALVGDPEPVERRDHGRVPVELEVSAWSLAQPTRRIAGKTVNMTPGGALLRLPDLAPFAATLELTIALPHEPLHVSSAVRWRSDPALVGVEFGRISPAEQARLVEFLRAHS